MSHILLGALIGDLCGSPYEFAPERNSERVNLARPDRRFTDDTVLTLAIAKAILERRPYRDALFELACRHPNVGYGSRFRAQWLEQRRPEPYGSYGNGAAMRVSPIAWAFNTLPDVLREAEASVACTHNTPEAIASAQATALAIFLARKGQDKDDIRAELEARFAYTFPDSLEDLRSLCAQAGFDATYRAVPLAIATFLYTDSFDDCLRQAIALGGDADTQAAIACSIAEAYYGLDDARLPDLRRHLTPDLLRILDAFSARYGA